MTKRPILYARIYELSFCSVLVLTLALTGCTQRSNDATANLGPPPPIYIFFEPTQYHVLTFEKDGSAQYDVLDSEDRSVIDSSNGQWEDQSTMRTVTFPGADESFQWTLEKHGNGYTLSNVDMIELSEDAADSVTFEPVSNFAVALRAYEWQLSHVVAEDYSEPVATPSLYTLQIFSDDHYAIRSDCNRGRGRYSHSQSNLTLQPGVLTRTMCPENSLSDQYLIWLANDHELMWGSSYGQLILQSKDTTLTFDAANIESTQ